MKSRPEKYKLDAHRLIGLIARRPAKKWKLRVWQYLLMRARVMDCLDCRATVKRVAGDAGNSGFDTPTPN